MTPTRAPGREPCPRVGPDRAPLAYRLLSKVCHPDHGGDHQLQLELNQAFAEIDKEISMTTPDPAIVAANLQPRPHLRIMVRRSAGLTPNRRHTRITRRDRSIPQSR
jgi:hypothetical protein